MSRCRLTAEELVAKLGPGCRKANEVFLDDKFVQPATLAGIVHGVPTPSESQSQQALIRWWAAICGQHGLAEELLIAVPLQAARTARNGARMKAEGARAGTPDLMLIVPRGGHPLLAIEMKRGGTAKGYLSQNQKRMLKLLVEQGCVCVVARSTDEARRAIETYLMLPS
jgi:VRR-NUC domain